MKTSTDQRFRKREGLKLRKDFARVYNVRMRVADEGLVVYANRNGLTWSRLGLSVGKRVSRLAVQRNYVRRRIREAFRRQKDILPLGFDIICVAKPKARDRAWDVAPSVTKLIIAACRRADRKATAGD